MKQVAILQSGYVPWRGYFDLIHAVDEFIWYDDVQYTRRDWRSRNRIKTAGGLRWLTIPCRARGRPRIDQVVIADPSWQRRHWLTLTHAYRRTPHFADLRDWFAELYLGRRWRWLSDVNRAFIVGICRDILGLTTRFVDAAQFQLQSHKQERVLQILERVGADRYLTGPAARAYLDPAEFDRRGIELVWMDYGGYPEYPQLHGPFAPQVSILDLLFHVGAAAPWYIWGWRDDRQAPPS